MTSEFYFLYRLMQKQSVPVRVSLDCCIVSFTRRVQFRIDFSPVVCYCSTSSVALKS